MMLTNVKSMVAKAMAVGMVAGAFALATPQKAEAQVSFGVQVGYPPVYAYGPGYYARRDYDRLRYEEECRRAEFARREAWERHEAWERERDRRFDHHDRDWDRDRR